MTSFGLDDVRDSFKSDVTRFLSEVEKGARSVVSITNIAMPAERTWQLPLESMTGGLHGIVGSSSLISLGSMSKTAQRLEEIAGSAAESVRMLKLHSTRLRRIASLCLDGATDLRAILEHELGGRGGDAAARSAALTARIEAALSSISTTAEGASSVSAAPAPSSVATSPDENWDENWDDPPAAAPAAPTTPTAPAPPPSHAADELHEVFRLEAREVLTNLAGYLARIGRDLGDRDAATHCARLLHLLKGAAASVGLPALAEVSEQLYVRAVEHRDHGYTAERLRDLGTSIAALSEEVLGERRIAFDFELAPPASEPAAPAPAEPSVDEDDEPRAIFREEAAAALAEVVSGMAVLSGASGNARGVAVKRLEKLLHRLKGSALIVGETAFAAAAARGQTACEALEQVDVAQLRQIVAEMTAMVAPAPVPGAAESASSPVVRHRFVAPPAEEWDVYLEESSSLLDDLDRILSRLEQSARPVADLSTMFRHYHTLKGASNSVGLTPLGQTLHIIETHLEEWVAAPQLPELRGVVRVLADENAAVRTAIGRASSTGVIETDHARTAQRLASIADRGSTGSSWIASNDPVWAGSTADSAADESRESQAQHSSRASRLSEGGGSRKENTADQDDVSVERRYVRVAADRLDGLLDLVGELVVARSRIMSRIGRMRVLQDGDHYRHSAMIRMVDDFAASTQFANLDGRSRKLTARPVAMQGAVAGAASGAGFGSLELDQYEEIHVLSRQLDEAASDITEVRRDIGVEMQHLNEDADTLSSIVAGLQTEITHARMLTLETLFTRLHLPARDAAQRSGRELEITVKGESVSIDKSISDALYGPLLHLVRNAVVHGLEPADRRVALGKPRAGAISLTARQEQEQVILEIADDGAGIDVARLKAAGVERGLIDANVPETDPRVLDLVFAHGISTTDRADDVAGRGVGGSVVRKAVDRLNGVIQISTKAGAGTTFRIALPLTMSITQAVLLRTAGVTLAIPIAFAETIMPNEGLDVVETFGRARVRIGDRLLPIHDTRRLFPEVADRPVGALVVCIVGGERVAVIADEVIGQEEIVVKSLGTLLDGHPLFSGSTQRGDGELVLILDIPGAVANVTATGEVEPAAPIGPVSASSAQSVAPSQAHSAVGPAPAPTAVPADPAKILLSEVAPLPTDRPRVLFVDDSLSVRKVGERMLASIGADVVTAVDGQDALDKLRSMSFSLVFTDLEMPRMHGFDLIREMQYLPAYRAIPVVVISSRSSQKHIDQAISMGAREYLTKPFTPEILAAVIERHTTKRGAHE